MIKKISAILLSAVLLSSYVIIIGNSSGEEGVAANHETIGYGLGGLWDLNGPTESETCHIVSPKSLLRDNINPLPNAIDNSAGLPPVGNQASQGSCTAWAIGYYHTTYIENRESPFDLTDPANQASPAFLYNIANGGADGGSYMQDVADLIISNGVCSMAEKPYDQYDETSWPEEDWIWVSGMKRKAISQNWLDMTQSWGLDALKAHLAAGNTATTGIDVWGNFDYIENFNYVYSSAEKFGSNRGGHIVTICGYDDDFPTADGPGALKMVNSWGTGWGDAGYWWMSYGALVDWDLCYGWAMYLESEYNYQTRMVAKVGIDHESRGDVYANQNMQIWVRENDTWLYGKTFLSCYWMEDWYGSTPIQQHPFPTGKMAFDISELMSYMDMEQEHDITLFLTNTGLEPGVLWDFEVLCPDRWEGGISLDTPMDLLPDSFPNTDAHIVPGIFTHVPIRVDSDMEMAHQSIGEFWQGNGTPENPYIIPDYTINGTDNTYCVFISNTSASIMIKGSHLESAHGPANPYYLEAGICLYRAHNVELDGNTLSYSVFGISLAECSEIVVTGNDITENECGIYVVGSSGIQILENNISHHIDTGIYMENSSGNDIYHNNIIDNVYQAYDSSGLNSWDNGYPSGGNYWNDYTELDVMKGPMQDIPGADWIGDIPYAIIDGGMETRDNYPLTKPTVDGRVQRLPFRINSNADFDWDHGIVNWETGDGTEINPWVIENWDVNGTGYGYCIYIGNTTEHFIARNCNLHDASGMFVYPYFFNTGLTAVNVKNGHVKNCEFTENFRNGLWFYGSRNCTIEKNDLTGNQYGLAVTTSSGIVIEGNNLAFNQLGLSLSSTSNNTVIENTMFSNSVGVYVVSSVPWTSSNNTFLRNTVLQNSNEGFYMISTEDNIIQENHVELNQYGFYLMNSYFRDNLIMENHILNNSYGILLDNTGQNMICHNNIINNAVQASDDTGNTHWNQSYPSGGNYWSDYSGGDAMSGPGQNESGSDGIGDSPYLNIQGGAGAIDQYPLMVPWGQVPGNGTHTPIRINSDADFDREHGVVNWATGNGTEWNPWIIAGWNIDGAGYAYCIYIGNTTEHYIVRDNNLHNASGGNYYPYFSNSGLILDHAPNGMAYNNSLSLNEYSGIYVHDTDGVLVSGNVASLCGFGVYLQYSEWCTVSHNILTRNVVGILLILAENNTLMTNNLSENQYGIQASLQSNNNTFVDNNVTETGGWGIYIENSGWNTIRNNSMQGCNRGIYTDTSNGNEITSNVANGCQVGIMLRLSSGNILSENVASGNEYGIWIQMDSSDNILIENRASNNTVQGFVVDGSTFQQLINNTADNCLIGFYITYSDWNVLTGNTACANTYHGINLFESSYNTISHNTLESNLYQGIFLYYNSTDNVIRNNTVAWNQYNGIRIRTDSDGNMIYHNNFIGNAAQAYDACNNSWDNGYPSGGNYWSDYSGTDGFSGPGQDQPGSDGIGDTPYTFSGNQDNYPLMSPWTPPILVDFEIELIHGWNLISIPLGLADTSMDSIFSSITGKWDVAKCFDGASKTWVSYRIGGVQTFTDMNCGMGVWLHATENCTLTVSGEEPMSTGITLYAGWNLVGYPSITEISVGDAFWGTSADRVEVFDPASPYMISAVAPEYIMKPGEGYWVRVPADTVWVIDW